MQQKNPAGNFFNDMQSTMKQLMGGMPATTPVDLKSILEAQRKNVQAITEANKRVIQGWQTLAQRQTEMITQFVQDNSTLARETFAEGTPESKLARQAEIMKSNYEASMSNAQELVEMMTRCTKDTADVINKRIMASFSEAKNSAQKGE